MPDEQLDDSAPVEHADSDAAAQSDPILRYTLGLREDEDRKYSDYVRQGSYAIDIQAAYNEFDKQHSFEPGQLVQWKPFMKNRRFPAYGAPAIVVGPFLGRETDGDGDPVVERDDIALGILDGEQSFRIFPFPQQRFTTWE